MMLVARSWEFEELLNELRMRYNVSYNAVGHYAYIWIETRKGNMTLAVLDLKHWRLEYCQPKHW